MNSDSGKPYGISAACRVLKVSRAAYYKWLNHKPTAHQLENEAILAYMIELEENNHYIFGVKRLVTYINVETSYHVSHGRVRRIMRRNHIQSSIRVAKRDHKVEKKEYLLANKLYTEDTGHAFHPIGPNLVMVTDCSELTYGTKG